MDLIISHKNKRLTNIKTLFKKITEIPIKKGEL